MNGLNLNLTSIILSIVPILFHLTLHEWAHGFAAYQLGDMTAKQAGRLSINPLRHLDPIGTFMLLFCGFGYAKPVPVNMYNFKHPKRDMAITAAAGPAMNILLACIAAFIMGVTSKSISANSTTYVMLQQMIRIGASLAVFNLIPIPPLDGSKIVLSFFPDGAYNRLINGSTVTGIILMVLLFTGIIYGPLYIASNWIIDKILIFQKLGMFLIP